MDAKAVRSEHSTVELPGLARGSEALIHISGGVPIRTTAVLNLLYKNNSGDLIRNTMFRTA